MFLVWIEICYLIMHVFLENVSMFLFTFSCGFLYNVPLYNDIHRLTDIKVCIFPGVCSRFCRRQQQPCCKQQHIYNAVPAVSYTGTLCIGTGDSLSLQGFHWSSILQYLIGRLKVKRYRPHNQLIPVSCGKYPSAHVCISCMWLTYLDPYRHIVIWPNRHMTIQL